MKKLYLVLSVFCLAATVVNAGGSVKTMVASSNPTKSSVAASASSDADWCGNVYVGHAWTSLAGVANPDTDKFTNVADSDTDNSKLGRGSFVGMSLNRHLWSWFSVGVSYDIYTSFAYHLHHAGATSLALTAGNEVIGTASQTVTFDRSFDLSHQSALFNVNLNLPEDWALSVGSMNISPVIGGGVGVGMSKVSNFKLTGWNTSGSTLQVTSVALPNSKASLAWQASGGINFQPEDSNVSFGFGYRYYHGGDFASAKTFTLNDSTNDGAATEIAAWTGKLKTHQVRMCLDLEF